eukprot:7008140-Lingulodinium_polyedra.AAC.1
MAIINCIAKCLAVFAPKRPVMDYLSGYKSAASAFAGVAAVYNIPEESIVDALEIHDARPGLASTALSL